MTSMLRAQLGTVGRASKHVCLGLFDGRAPKLQASVSSGPAVALLLLLARRGALGK